MSRKTLLMLGCIVVSIISASCSKPDNTTGAAPDAPKSASPAPSQTDGPPADVVQASAQQVELVPGGKAVASITVIVKNGYHINANPASKFQIETKLDVAPLNGIRPGVATYPPGVLKTFSFSPDQITVYEAEVVIKQTLQASADSVPGNHSLSGKLRVQPCDDSVCYPPRTLPVSIPVIVK